MSGHWADVVLSHNEVAVLFGSMAHHVSGGLFTPASYRVVRFRAAVPECRLLGDR